MKSNLTVCLCAGALLVLPSALVAASPLRASGAQKSTSNNAKTNSAKASKSKQLSADALHLLQQVGMARQAISAKDTKKAVSDIDHALAERSKLATASKAEGQSMVVPLYSELDDNSTLGPVLAARKGQQQPNLSKPLTVEDASVQYTFVGLDLDKAKSRLEAAKTALHNNNTQAASDSLAAIGSDLTVESSSQDVPLLAIRENLGMAQTAVKHAKYADASASLKEAAAELKEYGNGSAAHAQDAQKLHDQVDALSKTISEHHSNAKGTIEGWWQEVDSWFTAHA